jgi:hypothetical protein
MINSVEHPGEGSQLASVQEPSGMAATGPVEPEKDSYEWNLFRCENPAHFYVIEVGESMRAIRDRELFRAEYSTWAEFCQEKLKISVNQAEQRIQSAEIAAELVAADCVHIPFSESQCRPLMRLEPGFLRFYAWELTCSLTPVGKAPTGHDVMRAVRLLESWRPPINQEKRGYFDFRKLLYESRIPIKLAEGLFNSSRFQHWLKNDATRHERRLLKTTVEDLARRLNSLKVDGDSEEGEKARE